MNEMNPGSSQDSDAAILRLFPAAEVEDWLGQGGVMRVGGINYHLPSLEADELAGLENLLSQEADDIRSQLAERDVEGLLTGSLLYEVLAWRNRARHALRLRKRQMAAIHTEFSRRKTLLPSLDSFAWQAILEVCGKALYDQVRERARLLQDALRIDMSRRAGVPLDYGPAQRVHDNKIRYESQDDGVAAIVIMEKDGLDVRNMSCYGPCPFCGGFHIGHKLNSKRRKKTRLLVDKSNQHLH